MSTTTIKSVRFAVSLTTSTFSYPRVEAVDIRNVYYQDEDYRRFRQETWLEKMRIARAEARQRAITDTAEQLNKESQRRDAMRSYGKNSRGKVHQERGVALAA